MINGGANLVIHHFCASKKISNNHYAAGDHCHKFEERMANPNYGLHLVLVYGLPGSGKTHFSKKLSDHTLFRRISSDEIRHELGLRGNYSPEAGASVYDQMLARAKDSLVRGESVIVDANFPYKSQREEFQGAGLQSQCSNSLYSA